MESSTAAIGFHEKKNNFRTDSALIKAVNCTHFTEYAAWTPVTFFHKITSHSHTRVPNLLLLSSGIPIKYGNLAITFLSGVFRLFFAHTWIQIWRHFWVILYVFAACKQHRRNEGMRYNLPQISYISRTMLNIETATNYYVEATVQLAYIQWWAVN